MNIRDVCFSDSCLSVINYIIISMLIVLMVFSIVYFVQFVPVNEGIMVYRLDKFSYYIDIIM